MVSRKKKKLEDPIIAKANQNIRVLEKEADQATHEFYQRDLDEVFDPAERKALAKKLDLTEDAILDELQTISERKEQQKIFDKVNDDTVQAVKDAVDTVSIELVQFFDESVNKYVIKERAIDAEIEAKHPTKPLSKEEELASALKLMKDKYTDKNGVLNEDKLSKFIISNPDILKSIGGDMGFITDSVDSKNEPHVSDNLISSLIGVPFNSGKTDKIIAKKAKELADLKDALASVTIRLQKRNENNLRGKKPQTIFMIKVGRKAYEDYTNKTLTNNSEVNYSAHLREFHADKKFSERMDDDMEEQRGLGLKLEKPKSDNGSTWMNMQREVLKKKSITSSE